MKVEPELMDHPKYLLLKREIGDVALECLLRIWGHCESNKRGEHWRGATPEYVEVVCRWKKTAGKLFSALKAINWLEVTPEGIRIHDWDKTNWRAVSNWELGSRPKPQAQAKVKPRLNQGISPLSEGVSEGVSEAGSPTQDSPEVAVPSLEECRAWAVANDVDPDWAERKWKNTDYTHGWERNGRLIDWGKLWKVWYLEDVRLKKWPLRGSPAPGSTDKRDRGEILQELSLLSDSEKNGPAGEKLRKELAAA